MTLTTLLQAASLLLIIWGWSIVRRSSRQLATRSEDHALYNRTIQDIKSIELLAHDFWLGIAEITPGSWVKLSMLKIKNIRALNLELTLRGYNPITPREIVNLRKALTLDADIANYKKSNVIHARIKDVTSACIAIQSSMMQQTISKHPPESR